MSLPGRALAVMQHCLPVEQMLEKKVASQDAIIEALRKAMEDSSNFSEDRDR